MKRLVTCLSVTGLMAAGLSGCGESGAGGANEIKVLNYYTKNTAASVGAVLTRCAAEQGMTFSQESVPTAQLVPRILKSATSHTMPDLVMVDNPDLPRIAQTGALSDLRSLGVSTAGLSSQAVSAGTYEGTLYGLAPTMNTIALYYNKTIFDAAGLKPPTTWPELQATAKKLSVGSQYGLAVAAVGTAEGTFQYLPWMWSNGGEEDDLGSPTVGDGAAMLAAMIRDHSLSRSAVTWDQNDTMDQFKAGKAAMVLNGPWQVAGLKKDAPDLKWGVVTVPVPKAGDISVSPLGGEVWAAPRTEDGSKGRKIAKVIQCANTKQSQLAMAAKQATIPTRADAVGDYTRERPELTAFVTQFKTARSRTAKMGVGWQAAATAIYTALQNVLVNGEPPTKAFASAGKDDK